jgi:hypothetical protein
MDSANEAGAALLAALTGLSPSPGGGESSAKSSTPSSESKKSFNIGGSAALKEALAASKGFKLKFPKFGGEAKEKEEAKESEGEEAAATEKCKTENAGDSSSSSCGKCIAIDESDFTYEVDLNTPEPPCKCGKVQPIAKIKTESNTSENLKLIAANKDFICYALKSGGLRVIHTKSAKTALLHGHGAAISFMKFFDRNSSVFGSISRDGIFIARKLIFKQSLESLESGGDSKISGEIAEQVILRVELLNWKEQDIPSYFDFFPNTHERVVLVRKSYMCVVDMKKIVENGFYEESELHKLSCKTCQPQPRAGMPKELLTESENCYYVHHEFHQFPHVNAISTMQSSDSEVCVYAGSVGKLTEFELTSDGTEFVKRITNERMFPGRREFSIGDREEEVTMVQPLPRDAHGRRSILVGSDANRIFRIVGEAGEALQKIQFGVGEGNRSKPIDELICNKVAYDTASSLLVCCNVHKPKGLYTVLVALDSEGKFSFRGMKGFDVSTLTSKDSVVSFELMSVKDEGLRLFGVQNASVAMFRFEMDEMLPSVPKEKPVQKQSEHKSIIDSMNAKQSEKKKKMTVLSRGEKLASNNSPPPAEQDDKEKPMLLTPTQILQRSHSSDKGSDASTTSPPEESSKEKPKPKEKKNKAKNSTNAVVAPAPAKKPQKAKDVVKTGAVLEEGGMDAMVEKVAERYERVLIDRINGVEASMKREKEESVQQMGKLIKSISQSINKDIPRLIQKIVEKELVLNLRTQASQISQMIKTEFETAQGSVPLNTVKMLIETQMEEICKETLDKAMGTHMQEVIVPSFEGACREMFSQMHEVMEKGMQRSSSTNGKGGSTSDVAGLSKQVQTLTESVKRLEVSLKQSNTGAVQSHQQKASTKGSAPQAPVVEQKQDPKVEIGQHLSEKNYEEAFCKALVAQNIELVIWLCQQLNEEEFFYEEPFPVSQTVLLALLQQLGSEMKGSTKTKLSWIQKISLSFDMDFFKNRGLLPQLLPVLSEVQNNINAFSKNNSGGKGSIRVVMAVLNSVLLTARNFSQ